MHQLIIGRFQLQISSRVFGFNSQPADLLTNLIQSWAGSWLIRIHSYMLTIFTCRARIMQVETHLRLDEPWYILSKKNFFHATRIFCHFCHNGKNAKKRPKKCKWHVLHFTALIIKHKHSFTTSAWFAKFKNATYLLEAGYLYFLQLVFCSSSSCQQQFTFCLDRVASEAGRFWCSDIFRFLRALAYVLHFR